MKKILLCLGAAMSALFLCHAAQANQDFIQHDNYLVATTTFTQAGPITGVNTPNKTLGNIVYFRTAADSYLSAEAVVSVSTPGSQTFTDGSQSTGSFTVTSYTALSTAAATGQFTMVSASIAQGVVASTSIFISSNVAGTVIQITGPPLANLPPPLTIGGNVAQGFSSTSTAVNLAAFITTTTTSGLMTSTVYGSSVTISFVSSGTFGNAYSITSSSPAAVSSQPFVGGVDPVSLIIGGSAFTAGVQFQTGTSSAAMATNLAAAIASDIPLIATATASATCPGCGIVYATATVAGSLANTYALASSNQSAISTSAVFMSGGQDNQTVTENGVTLTANVNFYPMTSSATTATNIANAFNNSVASLTVTNSAAFGVVYTTSNVVGASTNYAVASSSDAALTDNQPKTVNANGSSTGFLTGGTNSAYMINSPTVTITNHGFATGLPVLYTTGTVAIQGLTSGTTYYIISVDANDVALATTVARAVAGQGAVIISSSVQTTAHTYTLKPLGISGTPAMTWVASDDAINWQPFATTVNNVTVPSVTYTNNYSTGTVNIWDFGHMDYAWFGSSITPPTNGALNMQIKVIGKTQ